MALSVLSFACVITMFACGALPGVETRNFPLEDCSTDEMDILFLFLDTEDSIERSHEQMASKQLVQDLLNVSSYKTTPRVMFADVVDKFSASNPQVNVSSWRLHSSPQPNPYGLDSQQTRKYRYRNVQEATELKIQFVERLFSEMGGVRENATRIAVVFLNGADLSFEECRRVPHIVQQQGTDIKIFVVVVNNQYLTETIYLNDTVLIDTSFYIYSLHGLTLAICRPCMDGWFMFEHNDSARSLSCYKVFGSNDNKNWCDARNECRNEGAQLAAIETEAELSFLKTKLSSYLTEMRNHSDEFNQPVHSLVHVYISLRRDFGSTAKRFKWIMPPLIPYRPLVVHNWMFGNPSGGRSKGCGAWRFVWGDHVSSRNEQINESISSRNDQMNDTIGSKNDQVNDTISSRNDEINETISSNNEDCFVEGWVDVECDTKLLSFMLCEMVVPRRIDDTNLVRIKPATPESFSQALTKGDYTTFGGNIVSVSANIASKGFLQQFLQQTDGEFPLFNCGVGEDNPQYISYVYVCDNVDHCMNRRDETFCTVESQITKMEVDEYSVICKGVYCCDGSCLPLQWVNDGEVDCLVCGYGLEKEVDDESEVLVNYLKINETCAFICSEDTCVSFLQLNNTSMHCLGAEGRVDETLRKLKTSGTCHNTLDHFVRAPMCVYIKDRHGAVLGCRNMSHLQGCTEVECAEGYFKCPNTYCIPQQYVFDGEADCPSGEEEQTDIIGPCTGNFACWDSKICLHPLLVCDGHPDCPHGDDEVDCRLLCPEGFRCILGTLTVSDYNRSVPLKNVYPKDGRLKYLDMSGLDLSSADITELVWRNKVLVIIFSNCKIGNSRMQQFTNSQQIRELDVSYNLIQALDGSYTNYSPLQNVRHLNVSHNMELAVVKYLEMTFLETLDLSHTGLSDIDESFLVGLPNLKHLNLSFTFVTGFRKNVFPSGLVLQTLDLRGLPIAYFYEESGLTISQHLYTDSFEFCCPQIRGANIPDHTCHAPGNAISSCFDLVGVNVQRVLLWVVAVLAVLGNMTVIVYRVVWDRSVLRTGYGLFVTNLGISDFIMGVYLFIIAGADYYYRGVYVLYDKSWRESSVCRLAGFLATLSSETSTFFVLLITVDRFLMMKFPFGHIKFSKISKSVALFLSWVIGFLLALIPAVFQFEIFSSNAMCLGLPLTTKKLTGWEFSFGVFIVLNFLTCPFIAYGQRAIFRAMSENRISENASSRPTSHRRVEDILVAKQLSLVALSNFLCWFPIGTMGLLSLGGHEINNDVYAWTTIIVLPINSAANPLLYTIPVIMTKWQKFKSGGSRSHTKST